MKFWKNVKINDKGFSLVELLIAVAIAGIVGASVFGFMTVGVKNFSHSSADVSIQNEQQLAFNQIQDLVIDTAVGVEYYDKSTNTKVSEDSEIPTGHDKMLRLNNLDSIYEIVWKAADKKLYYNEYTASVNPGGEVVSTGWTVKEALMSEYIEGFAVDLSRLLSSRVVRVELTYNKGNRSLTSSHNITLRNQVVSTNKIEEKLKDAYSVSVNTIPNEIKGKKIIYAEPGETIDLKTVKEYDTSGILIRTGYEVFDTSGANITSTQPLGFGFATGSAHNTSGVHPTQIGYSNGILFVSEDEDAGSFNVVVYCTSNPSCKKVVEVRVVRTVSVSVNFIKGAEAKDEISSAATGDKVYEDDLSVNETFELEATAEISWTYSKVSSSERDPEDTTKLQNIEDNIRNGLAFKGLTGYDNGTGAGGLFKATGSLSDNPCEFKMSSNFSFGVGEASYYTQVISARAYCGYSLSKYGGDKHADWTGAAYRKKADFSINISSDLKRGKPNYITKTTDSFTCAKGFAGDFWTNHVQLLEVTALERNYNIIDPDTGMPQERQMAYDEYIRTFDPDAGSNEGNTNTWICPVDWRLDCEYEFMFTLHIAHAKNPSDASTGIYVLPYGGYTEADYEYTSNTSDAKVFSPFSISFAPKAKYNNIVINQLSDPNKNETDLGNNAIYYVRNFGEYLPRGMKKQGNYTITYPSKKEYTSKNKFPKKGTVGNIYIDGSTSEKYSWDGNKYYSCGEYKDVEDFPDGEVGKICYLLKTKYTVNNNIRKQNYNKNINGSTNVLYTDQATGKKYGWDPRSSVYYECEYDLESDFPETGDLGFIYVPKYELAQDWTYYGDYNTRERTDWNNRPGNDQPFARRYIDKNTKVEYLWDGEEYYPWVVNSKDDIPLNSYRLYKVSSINEQWKVINPNKVFVAEDNGEYYVYGNNWADDPIALPITLNDQFTYRTDVWSALIENKSTKDALYKWKAYEPVYGQDGSLTFKEYNSKLVADYNMDQNDVNNNKPMFRYFISQEKGGFLSVNAYKDNLDKDIPSRLRITPDIYWQGVEYNEYFADRNYVECVFWNITVPYKSILGDLYKTTGWGKSYDTCYFPGPDEPNFPGAKQSAVWYYAGYGNDAGYPTLTADDNGKYYNLRYSLSSNKELDGTDKWTLKLMYETSGNDIKDIATYTYNDTSKTWEIPR